jgi:hypothetical protein
LGRAGENAGEDHAGRECPTGASHGFSIGAAPPVPEGLDG